MEFSRILVTGATGFIGRYLFEQLVERGYEVLGISKKGGAVAGRTITALDITDELAVNEFLGKNRFDIIFHLACYIPREGHDKPFESCWRVNGVGTRNLVRAAAGGGGKRFVYTSSQTVCHGAGRTYVKEDFEAPGGEYGVTKLAGEHLGRIYAGETMSLIILRYSSVYGFGEVAATVIPKFLEKICRNQPLKIWGDGSSLFDFIYVKDAVELTLKAGLGNEVGIFNAGSGEPTSVKVLAETLAGLCPEANITFDESQADAGRRFCFDMEKTRKTFNYLPRYSLKDGLKEYLGELAKSTCLNQ
ncbi:MAG: NAD(P)-dependent oxidoreductase [Planctomycetes bacterium]|nr:NAD(P)-dependent oxidoreductase [Planctomycetota bacterium]